LEIFIAEYKDRENQICDESRVLFMNKKYQRNPDVLFENFDGEAVILSLTDGCYYGLDPVARLIWESLSSPKSLSEICTIVAENFEIEGHPVDTHVEEFLGTLLEPGLAQIAQS